MIQKRPVWDLPTRVFHWGLAVSVSLSMLIVYGKKYIALHILSGAIALALILGRIVWGFAGTRYVRFPAFFKGIKDIKNEFSLFKDSEHTHSVGHPAVAGWVMLLLMFCALGVGVSGVWLWQFTAEIDKERILLIHEIFANTLLAIAFVHIQGVLLHIFLHRDGIVRAMIDGKRPALESEQITPLSTAQKTAALLWLCMCVVAFLLAYQLL